MNRDLARYWPLDPSVTYLNHGSFGACPWPVLQEQSELRARMERQPVRFLDGELEARLDDARAALGEFLGADASDVAFVPNATTGVNTILRSLHFTPGDEILTTDHEYNACLNAIRFVAGQTGARMVIATIAVPIASAVDVTEALLERVTERTKLVVISHVTSPTGLIFPIPEIVAALDERGIDTLVDGAHAPGMLPLDIDALGAAYYTGNAHKWLCAPKGSGFLHVRRDRQADMRPLVISHGANSPRTDRSAFRLEFDWGGTGDPTPFLSIAAALRFMAGLLSGGWSELQAANRNLALAARNRLLDVTGATRPLAPDEMVGSLAAVELPGHATPGTAGDESQLATDDNATYPLDPLHDALIDEERIEVPVYPWPHTPAESSAHDVPVRRLLRVSAQAYNSIDDYERLATALASRI